MNMRTIEECFYQIRNGVNIKQGTVDGGYPITRIETIANDKFNRDRMGYAGITDLEKYESYVLEDGDLLMSHINSIQYLGRTVLYKKHGKKRPQLVALQRTKCYSEKIRPVHFLYIIYMCNTYSLIVCIGRQRGKCLGCRKYVRINLVFYHMSVTQTNVAAAVLGYFRIVRDKNNCLSLGMQFLKQH